MLIIDGVSKRYGKLLANDNVSLRVDAGQIGILLGPNGAGKSTLIKCVAGLLRFDGRIELAGHPNKSLEAKRALGYVPEIPAIYDLLTVSEHLEFIRRAYRLGDTANDERALLERFELADKADKLGKELSKGMQQKLSLCMALLTKPQVIVFDEPMVGLDPHAIRELKAVFGELRARGAAVLISTHMLDSVEDAWDEAFIMMRGKIAASVRNQPGAGRESLETLFFEITEGKERQA